MDFSGQCSVLEIWYHELYAGRSVGSDEDKKSSKGDKKDKKGEKENEKEEEEEIVEKKEEELTPEQKLYNYYLQVNV